MTATRKLRKAQKRITQGKPKSALKVLDGLGNAILTREDRDTEHSIRIMALYGLARYDETVELGAHLLQTNTFVWNRTDAMIRYYLALAHQARGELSKALELVEQVANIRGDHQLRARELIPELTRQIHSKIAQTAMVRRDLPVEPDHPPSRRPPTRGVEESAAPDPAGIVAIRPGARIDKYVIESEIGQGGMAFVFKVRHDALGSHHAMKVLAPDLVRDESIRSRFLAEGQIQARLRHPNIVPVTDLVAVPGVAALVMDYIEGDDLHTYIQRLTAPPDSAEIRSLFAQVLSAVGFAHEAGVIHRDLKPSNVLVERPKHGVSRALVLDFGIAKIADGRKGVTRTRAVLGTPAYMSPEQIRGARDVTPQSDIFSLGVMLYELTTLSEPFGGDSDFDIQSRIVNGQFSPASEKCPTIDRGISRAIDRALAVDPARRFASCRDFALAVAAPG